MCSSCGNSKKLLHQMNTDGICVSAARLPTRFPWDAKCRHYTKAREPEHVIAIQHDPGSSEKWSCDQLLTCLSSACLMSPPKREDPSDIDRPLTLFGNTTDDGHVVKAETAEVAAARASAWVLNSGILYYLCGFQCQCVNRGSLYSTMRRRTKVVIVTGEGRGATNRE